MSNFSEAFDITFKIEGGFVDDENDRGGATKFGISLRFLKTLPVSHADFNGDGLVTMEDIYNLTPENAKDFYLEYFWDALQCDKYPKYVATLLFDAAVNCGAVAAGKMLQRACNAFDCGLVVDGVCGSRTRAAVAATSVDELSERMLCMNMLHQRQMYYNELADSDMHRPNHLGWTRRASGLFEIIWPTEV